MHISEKMGGKLLSYRQTISETTHTKYQQNTKEQFYNACLYCNLFNTVFMLLRKDHMLNDLITHKWNLPQRPLILGEFWVHLR